MRASHTQMELFSTRRELQAAVQITWHSVLLRESQGRMHLNCDALNVGARFNGHHGCGIVVAWAVVVVNSNVIRL